MQKWQEAGDERKGQHCRHIVPSSMTSKEKEQLFRSSHSVCIELSHSSSCCCSYRAQISPARSSSARPQIDCGPSIRSPSLATALAKCVISVIRCSLVSTVVGLYLNVPELVRDPLLIS